VSIPLGRGLSRESVPSGSRGPEIPPGAGAEGIPRLHPVHPSKHNRVAGAARQHSRARKLFFCPPLVPPRPLIQAPTGLRPHRSDASGDVFGRGCPLQVDGHQQDAESFEVGMGVNEAGIRPFTSDVDDVSLELFKEILVDPTPTITLPSIATARLGREG